MAAHQVVSEEQIVQAGLNAVERALDCIYDRATPEKHGLDELFNRRLKKWMLSVDYDAQMVAEKYLKRKLPGIEIRGEESDLKAFSGGLAALLDMLDGSDLLKRNLGNWCSAATIFDSEAKKIITAIVGMPNGSIYFTQNSNTGCAFVRAPGNRSRAPELVSEVKLQQRAVKLRDASIAFYGQKPAKLVLLLTAKLKIARWLRSISKEMQEKREDFDCPQLRMYTLAGNPRMVNLIEGGVDAVVELSGQRCHDVVPGFIIALRAGAVLKDLSNNDLTEEEIVTRLSDPSKKFKYVLACDKALANELVDLLQPAIRLVPA